MLPDEFTPKFWSILREGVSATQVRRDILAGLTVAIVALPLSIALAVASGVRPEQGLITAIIGGAIVGFLGGSRVQIGGAGNAFIVISYGIVERFGYQGLAVATLIAGVILVLMGILKLGSVIQYIPFPVTLGFTCGIAVMIGVSQLRDLLGLQLVHVPADFVHKLTAYAQYIDTGNIYTVGIGLFTLFFLIGWPRYNDKIPGPLAALMAATLIVKFFELPVETLGSRFGELPHLPGMEWPWVSFDTLRKLIQPGLSLAIIAGIESLLAATVSDGMTGNRHKPNIELVAQGIANLGSAFFQGIPTSGAMARTVTNVRSGGRTPIAGIAHAVILLFFVLLFGRWVNLIPLPALAGILILIAYRMVDWKLFFRIVRTPSSDMVVLMATFILTLLIDISEAVQFGVVLAALLFMRKMSLLTKTRVLSQPMIFESTNETSLPEREKHTVPPGVEVYEIYGPLFFGAAHQFKNTLRAIQSNPKALILRMRHVMTMDQTALIALEEVLSRAKKEKTMLILSGVKPEVRQFLEQHEFIEKLGVENLQPNLEAALEKTRKFVEGTA